MPSRVYTQLSVLLFVFGIQFPFTRAIRISRSPNNAPVVNDPVATQFEPSNPAVTPFIVSNNSIFPPGLWIPPSWSFSIGLQWDTFLWKDGKKDVTYSASLKGGGDLPSWIKFDSDTTTFDGVSPHPGRPQTIEIEVFPAEDDGAGSVSQSFNLTVAVHDLSTSSPFPTINLTEDTPFSFKLDDLILPNLRLDGETLNYAEGKSLAYKLDVSTPSWISLDADSRTIHGSPPSKGGSAPSPLLLTIPDVFNNQTSSLRVEIPLSIQSSYFSARTVPAMLMQPGTEFNFDFSPYVVNSTNGSTPNAILQATFEPKDSTDWFTLTSSPPRLHGKIPSSPRVYHVNVTVTAISGNTNATSAISLYLSLSSTTVGPNTSTEKGHHSHLSQKAKLAIALSLGIVGGLIVLCCILACCRKHVARSESHGAGLAGWGSRRGADDPFADGLNWVEKGNSRGGVSFVQAPLPSPPQETSSEDSEEISRFNRSEADASTAGMISKHVFFARPQKPARSSISRLSRDFAAPTIRKVSAASKTALDNTVHAFAKFKPSGPRAPISKPLPVISSARARPVFDGGDIGDSILGLEAGSEAVQSLPKGHHNVDVSTSDMSLEGGISLKEGSDTGVSPDSRIWAYGKPGKSDSQSTKSGVQETTSGGSRSLDTIFPRQRDGVTLMSPTFAVSNSSIANPNKPHSGKRSSKRVPQFIRSPSAAVSSYPSDDSLGIHDKDMEVDGVIYPGSNSEPEIVIVRSRTSMGLASSVGALVGRGR